MSALLSHAARLDPQRRHDLCLHEAALRQLHEAARDADYIAGERQASEEHLRDQFRLAVLAGNVDAKAYFAKHPSRVQSFGEVLLETLTETNRGFDKRLMTLLLSAAHGADVQALALKLLDEAGQEFARVEATV
jgi:hypothetical protein